MKRKSFTDKTMRDKICNKTDCDFNDFGRCLIEPEIKSTKSAPFYYRKVNKWICWSYDTRQMKQAEEELG